ncbi:MAG: 3-phosphoglycerate dehydrogenase family protein [Gammaproteobacteria bacterium]|nr:3-phosphoglycerate dehydrogenase family protein [Gammaproteobacteria bacterium]
MYRIRTINQIAPGGLERFSGEQFLVAPDTDDPHAILLRSHKLTAADINPSLRAVARAGAGVNNVPVEACTESGVVVFNTPGANANSVKELVLTGLLLASRDVIGGIEFVRELTGITDDAELNARVEADKKRFKGRELKGRSLGVVGLGAIGSLVARSALDLGMEVLGYDPAISVDAAWRLPAEVQRMENLQSLFARADYVTLHVPLLPDTEGMINQATLDMFRPGSVLLNFARQPIVDAGALRDALDSGRLGRYVADFPVPELTSHPRVLLTPHLGASTDEAEENCAIMAAEQLVEFLRTGNIRNSVNFPTVILEPAGGHRLAVTNHNVPGVLNRVTAVLAERQINVVDMINKSRNGVAYNLIDVMEALDQPTLDALCAIEHVMNVREFRM